MSNRKDRRDRTKFVQKRINETLAELNSLGQERLDIGNEHIEPLKMTSELYEMLENNDHPDGVLQKHWNRFQWIQQRMIKLKNRGSDLVVEKTKLMGSKKSAEFLAKFDKKQTASPHE